MRTVTLLLLLALAAFAQTPTNSDVWAIRAGTLIDGKSDQPRQNQVIVIRGNRIESVGDATSIRIPAGARVVDLSRATVLPGLIESHTRIFLQGEHPQHGGYHA